MEPDYVENDGELVTAMVTMFEELGEEQRSRVFDLLFSDLVESHVVSMTQFKLDNHAQAIMELQNSVNMLSSISNAEQQVRDAEQNLKEIRPSYSTVPNTTILVAT